MKSEYFESKHIYKEYIQFIHEIVSLNKDYEISELSKMIDDKDIVILDDTISTGATISASVEDLYDTFNPKSVTVITLLSKKFKNN